MAFLTGNDRSTYVQKMFTRIAKRYDLMNTLMTAGGDNRLRKEAVRLANLKLEDKVLDLGAGTGMLTVEAARVIPGRNIYPSDFTFEMLLRGSRWGDSEPCCADALQLPYADGQFDVVMSGFLVRNVGNLQGALVEQFRVLKPGGRLIILDATQPRKNIFSPLVNLYLKVVIPALGKMITGQTAAYQYLPESTRQFLLAEELTQRVKEAGFTKITFRIRMFGTMAIHTAQKPD
ncbi:MAG TPA: ubiquinone/menaquinone biosynthesis methyltransferase [Anaerolineaceae bacterium]|nr:ubiquinone/menaquinone biosynthesis methyltransferase [Anaerolineaceae bacterium]